MAEERPENAEALQIYRRLATNSPDTYLPDVANTLNNLAVLDHDENRMTEARTALAEALIIYQRLSKTSPAKFGGAVDRVQRLLADLDKSSGIGSP
jgi:tetratricopeptide (TPR) repeat protein